MSPSATAATPRQADAGTSWRVFAAAAFTVLAWASAFVVIRYVGQDYSPGGLSLGRLLVGSACLGVLAGLLLGEGFPPDARHRLSGGVRRDAALLHAASSAVQVGSSASGGAPRER